MHTHKVITNNHLYEPVFSMYTFIATTMIRNTIDRYHKTVL